MTIGQGNALVPVGSPIPSRDEIAKDLIKWFFGKYGAAAWDAFWSTPQPVQDLLDKVKEQEAQKQLSSGGGGGGGLAIAAIAALALTSSRRTKRGRKRRR
jgi:hypothetical protein